MRRKPLIPLVAGVVLAALAVALAASAQDSLQGEMAVRAYAPLLAGDSASLVPSSQTPTATPSPTGTSPATPTTTPSGASPTPTTTSTPTVTPTPASCSATPQALQTATLTVSQGPEVAQVVAELALTAGERHRGLMGRTALSDEQGMLFVFPGPATGGFWMLNTPIPLDIAYLDEAGEVLAIRHGVPCSTAALSPGQSYRYVLEVAGGWFERHGMGAGAVVSIPDDLPPAQ